MREPAPPRLEPVHQRLRAWLGGRQMLDTGRARLYFEDERRPLWAVARQDLQAALEPVVGVEPGPERPVRWDVVVGSVRRAAAARSERGSRAGCDGPGPIVDDTPEVHP